MTATTTTTATATAMATSHGGIERERVKAAVVEFGQVRTWTLPPPPRPFSPTAPTVAKNGATVTMSSGKPFDRQSALDLRADTSLTGLSLAHQRVLVTRSPTRPCRLLADASLLDTSLSLTHRCVLVTRLPMRPCRLLANVPSTQTCHRCYEFR